MIESIAGLQVLNGEDHAALIDVSWMIFHPDPFTSGVNALNSWDSYGRADKDSCLGRYLSNDGSDLRRMCFHEFEWPSEDCG